MYQQNLSVKVFALQTRQDNGKTFVLKYELCHIYLYKAEQVINIQT